MSTEITVSLRDCTFGFILFEFIKEHARLETSKMALLVQVVRAYKEGSIQIGRHRLFAWATTRQRVTVRIELMGTTN